MIKKEYLSDEALAPEWMKRFQCIGGRCPRTCCKGWDIEIDKKHAAFYEQIDASDISDALRQMTRKIHVKKDGKEKDEYRLHLNGMPGQTCLLMSSDGMCRLQQKYGAEALCDTCYFFPRLQWQIDERYYCSAGLSCPEVIRLAITNPTPIRFEMLPIEVDPIAGWMETAMIPDGKSQLLLCSREKIIMALIQILQTRRMNVQTRVFLCCQFLIKLGTLLETETPTDLSLEIDGIAETVLSVGGSDLTPGCFGEQETGLMIGLMRTFNWAAETNSKSLQEINHSMLEMLSGGKSPEAVMAANYRSARDTWYLPFIQEHAWLEENYMVHFAFSDMFKQFSLYESAEVSVKNIIRYEASLMTGVFCLFRYVQVLSCLRTEGVDEDRFLQAVYEMDNAYIHYPSWLNKSILRMPDVCGNPEIIAMMLSC